MVQRFRVEFPKVLLHGRVMQEAAGPPKYPSLVSFGVSVHGTTPDLTASQVST